MHETVCTLHPFPHDMSILLGRAELRRRIRFNNHVYPHARLPQKHEKKWGESSACVISGVISIRDVRQTITPIALILVNGGGKQLV
jgi:hypothetical protein